MIINNQRYFTKIQIFRYHQILIKISNQDNDFDYIYQEFLLIIKNP